MTKDQAEKIYMMHKELVLMVTTQYTEPKLNERNRIRFGKKQLIFKNYLESLIGNYMIVPLGSKKGE